jgi:hypothetical protein
LSSDYTLTIDWASAFVGAYQASDGTEIDGVTKCSDEGKENPTFDQDHQVDEIWTRLVEVTVDGATVQDLELVDTCGYGITMSEADDPDNLTFTRLEISDTGSGFIYTAYDSDNFDIGYGVFSNCNQRTDKTGCTKSYSNPQCINANSVGSSGGLIHHNILDTINESEGIGCGGHTCEYNVVYNVEDIGIYAAGGPAGATTTVRYNLVWGGASEAGLCQFSIPGRVGDRKWCGTGISTNAEVASSQNNRTVDIYGNVVIGSASGVKATMDASPSGHTTNIFNNTLIDNGYNIEIKKIVTNPYTLTLRNNTSIVYAGGTGAENDADHATNTQSLAAATIEYNFWHCVGANCATSGEAPDADFTSCSAVDGSGCADGDVIGDPGISTESGWDSLAATPATSTFDLDADSACIDGASGTNVIINPTSDFTASPPSVTTMNGDEIGAMGYYVGSVPPEGSFGGGAIIGGE